MRKLLLLLLTVISVSVSAQYQPSGSKVRYINGIGLGTKSDAAFGTVDSLVLYAKADSTLMFKFKGTARALAYAANSITNQIGGNLSTQTAKFRISDTARAKTLRSDNAFIDTSLYAATITAASAFVAASDGVAVNVTNNAATFTTLEVKNNGSGNLATFYNNTNTGVVITNSGNIYPQTISVGNSSTDGFQANILGSLPLKLTSNNTANVSTFGGVQLYRQTNTVGNGFGIVLGMQNSSNVNTETGYIGTIITTNTASSESGDLVFYTTLAGTPRNERLRIISSGDINLTSLGTGTVYSNSGTLTNTDPSDSTIKNTIKAHKYGLAEILKLQPKSFYYNSDSSKSSLKYGFIAQDVQKIMPDMVRKINPKDENSKLGLESQGIYVTLVKAIQEQQAIIDDLKKRIIALENK